MIINSCDNTRQNQNNYLSPYDSIAKNLPSSINLSIDSSNTESLSGKEILSKIKDLDLKKREEVIFQEIKRGNIPNFLWKMKKVTTREHINGANQYLTYYVLPDYLAVGNDKDYFICPLTPVLAQKIAQLYDCTVPTAKMVNQIWESAEVKMKPQPIPPSDQMTTLPIFVTHHDMVLEQRNKFLNQYPLGNMVAGHKKDLVISNLILNNPPPPRVVIYGWHQLDGVNIQPIYAGHHAQYVDYSHGVRLISNKAFLNDKEIGIDEILKSDELHVLLSDEGVIEGFYPY